MQLIKEVKEARGERKSKKVQDVGHASRARSLRNSRSGVRKGKVWVSQSKEQLTTVSADSLHLGELAHLGGSLDILEGDILVFAEVDNAAKVIEEAF